SLSTGERLHISFIIPNTQKTDFKSFKKDTALSTNDEKVFKSEKIFKGYPYELEITPKIVQKGDAFFAILIVRNKAGDVINLNVVVKQERVQLVYEGMGVDSNESTLNNIKNNLTQLAQNA